MCELDVLFDSIRLIQTIIEMNLNNIKYLSFTFKKNVSS